MTALIARQYIDGSKADTPSGVSVANFQLGLGNAWDCLQTLGVGLAAVVAGTTALTQANAGLLLIDATAGNVILNLPAASAAVGAVFQFKRLDSTANTVTVNRAGSDTIDGSTSFTLNSQFDYQEIRADGTSAWRVTTPKPLVVTTAGIATAYTVTTTPKVLAQVDTRIQVTWNVSNGGVACTLAANGGAAFGIKQYDSTGTKIDPTIVAAVKSDLVFDGTHWVILDPLPPGTSAFAVPVRQTVLGGPVDASGFPAFLPATSASLSLTSQNVSGGTPFVVTAANGFGTSGGVDRVGNSSANLTWSGLTANTTNYLYVDVAANGTLSPGSTTLLPTYQFGGTRSLASGQATFNIQEMSMTVGNGSVANQTYRVFVGEADTNASTVTATRAYAYQGRYDSGWFSPTANANTVRAHNLGIAEGFARKRVICKVTTAVGLLSVGDIIDDGYTEGGFSATGNMASLTRNNLSMFVQSFVHGVYNNAGTYTSQFYAISNFSFKTIVQREW